MKTLTLSRLFFVAIAMNVIACSDDEIEPIVITDPPPPILESVPDSIPGPVQAYYINSPINILTWHKIDSSYVAILAMTIQVDLTKVRLYVTKTDGSAPIDNSFDPANVSTSQLAYGGYFWASISNGVLQINYLGETQDSMPPYPSMVVVGL